MNDSNIGPHRANGIFDHEDPLECGKFYLCDKGTAHEMPCVSTLVFDVTIGSCVRPEEASPEARVCNTGDQENGGLKTIEGKPLLVGFIYILDSSNSSLFRF